MRSPRGKSTRLSLLGAVLVLSLGGFSNAAVHAQQAAPASFADWPASSYDYQNTNSDPQTTININNVMNLDPRWIYQVPVNPFSIPGAPPALGIETQPLIVKGVIYIATPYNRIIALSAATGGLLWYYQVNMTSFIGEKSWAGAYVISGISLYGSTLYVMASDTAVYALNAYNGTVEWKIPPIAANIDGNTGYYYGEKAPILVGDNLIVRASTTDYGGRGFVAAYNINTRNLAWTWYTVPPSGGDPNWDKEDMVKLANGTTVNYGQAQGNITPYPNDWGANNLMGGGAAWGLMAVDNKTGIIYFSTGHPSGAYDAALRPGPNLFTDCLVALNATNGKMVWYYQMTSHDLTEHEGGWSVSLSNITVNGTSVEVVVQGAKSNAIYVINAATGKPLYAPIMVGPKGENNWNDDQTTTANLTASQSLFGNNQRICPGPDGGVEMAPAISGNILYVATQNACGVMSPGPFNYKGTTINGYLYTGDPTAKQNATLYAIDLSTGKPVWHYNMPNRYQGSAAVVSGGVVYAVDRAGYLYEFDQQTGRMLRSLSLGGIGAAGVSIGEDSAGNMMLFAPAGGGDLPSPTAGILVAYWLSSTTGTGTGTGTTTSTPLGGLEEPIIIVLGVLVVVLAMYVLLSRRTPRQSAVAPQQARGP